MNELMKIGISPETINFSIKPEDSVAMDYHRQITEAALGAWGPFWPEHIRVGVMQSDLLLHIAETTARAARILDIKNLPMLGLRNGFEDNMLNCIGYCWEEEDQIWVGLNELWFGAISEEIVKSGHMDPTIRRQISFVMAEEVFHAYIRKANPNLAEENIKANATGNPEAYWNSSGERAAKDFATLYVAQENL
jgi:hypothetical protein